ncbi:hypothetical protein NC652_037202 [Populus alba x Populus x berolinensis]|nr:hypothetical protein NC652_037202 [Populus alba x Populus x berolinensis]
MNRGIGILVSGLVLYRIQTGLFHESRGTKWTPEEKSSSLRNALAFDTPDRWLEGGSHDSRQDLLGDVIKQYREFGGRLWAQRLGLLSRERKKGEPWTEREHKFLLVSFKSMVRGIGEISPAIMWTTRTPTTQVASHAQKAKYLEGRDKRRSSIHDITTVNLHRFRSPITQKTGRKAIHLQIIQP